MRIKMLKTRNYVDPSDKARRRTVQFLKDKIYPEVKHEWAADMIERREAEAMSPGTRPAQRSRNHPLGSRPRTRKVP